MDDAAVVGGTFATISLAIGVSLVAFALYFLPAIIAMIRKHHQTNMIAVLNFFLGWTFVGWVIFLAMAVGHTKGPNHGG